MNPGIWFKFLKFSPHFTDFLFSAWSFNKGTVLIVFLFQCFCNLFCPPRCTCWPSRLELWGHPASAEKTPGLWNILPLDVKCAPSFLSLLKMMHLILKAFRLFDITFSSMCFPDFCVDSSCSSAPLICSACHGHFLCFPSTMCVRSMLTCKNNLRICSGLFFCFYNTITWYC